MHSTDGSTRTRVEQLLGDGGGVLRLEPAFVARDLVPPGRRLGLPEVDRDPYDVGERGAICERWLASTTPADNEVGPEDEGLSAISTEDGGSRPLLLRDAVAAAPEEVMGAAYAAAHPAGLGRLPKLFDYAARLPYHVHPPVEYAALVGANPKDEAYHFLDPGTGLGAHPETFLGVHPWIAESGAGDVLLPYLVDWDSDLILRHSRAELQVAGEGFHIPSGVLHAPGTALTLELQEDSDVAAMFQALNAGRIISKELLFKDVRPDDRAEHAERFPLRFVDWEANGDPLFFEHHHLSPKILTPAPTPAPTPGHDPGVEEAWVFYGTSKFAGKRLTVPRGAAARVSEPGVHSVFVWSGAGWWAGHEVEGGTPGRDELLVSHHTATTSYEVTNTGDHDLVAFLLFGPDLHADTPAVGSDLHSAGSAASAAVTG